jgi:large repetitive protein
MNRAFTVALKLATAAVIFAGPASAQLANSSWAKLQGNAGNTGRTSIVAAGNRIAWTSTSYGGYEGASAAVGADGTIYSVGNGGLIATNPNGTRKWMYNGGTGSCTPTVGADGTIYYGSHTNYFNAVNPNGTLKWSYNVGSQVYNSSANIDSFGNAYVGTINGDFYSFRGSDGSLNWRQQGFPEIHNSPAIDSQGTILIGSGDGYLRAFKRDGSLKWKTSVGMISFSSAAVGADDTAYIGSIGTGAKLSAVRSDGVVKWTKAISGMNGAPAIAANGDVYVVTDLGLQAYSSTGTMLWSFAPAGITTAYFGSPVVDGNGTVYYTGRTGVFGAYLFAVGANGSERWRLKLSTTSMDGAPAIGPHGEIYLAAGALTCVAPEPSSLLALLCGLGAMGSRFRVRKKK